MRFMKNTVASLSLAALGSLGSVFGATAPKTLPLCAKMLHDAGYEYFFFADLASGM